MASLHVSGNRNQFTKIRACVPVNVQVADGRTVKVTQSGSVSLRVATSDGGSIKFEIPNVHYHESFTSNLLSLGVLRAQGWEMHSNKRSTHLVTPGGNKIVLETDGRVSTLNTVASESERVFGLSDISAGSVRGIVRLHEILGHIGFDPAPPPLSSLFRLITC